MPKNEAKSCNKGQQCNVHNDNSFIIGEHESSCQRVKTLRSALALFYDFAVFYEMFGMTRYLLPVLLVDSAAYHPERNYFP